MSIYSDPDDTEDLYATPDIVADAERCLIDLEIAPSASEPQTSETPQQPLLNTSEDIYAVINKSNRSSPAKHVPDSQREEDADLPVGWKLCADEEGDYYWHITTGAIQREKPTDQPESLQPHLPSVQAPLSPDGSEDFLKSMESSLINLAADRILSNKNQELDSVPSLNFSVHSLGWAPLSEDELSNPETSSKSINKCIHELTVGKNEGHTDGKALQLEIGNDDLNLIDPTTNIIITSQPIHLIRVWGVGSQNTSDFAYVARDTLTRIHRCHVFRCDAPAKQIAYHLKDICTRLAKERKPVKSHSDFSLNGVTRVNTRIPSPMEGPSKTKKCQYLGSTMVHKSSGTDVVNAAIETLVNTKPRSEWKQVNLTVSPAALQVTPIPGEGNSTTPILDCRLRFLCFFAISAHDVKMMGLIIHTAQNDFVCHVFHCDPSAGAVCKVVEAACKLRYQKLLDSKPPEANSNPTSQITSPTTPTTKSSVISSTVRNVFSKIWKSSS